MAWFKFELIEGTMLLAMSDDAIHQLRKMSVGCGGPLLYRHRHRPLHGGAVAKRARCGHEMGG